MTLSWQKALYHARVDRRHEGLLAISTGVLLTAAELTARKCRLRRARWTTSTRSAERYRPNRPTVPSQVLRNEWAYRPWPVRSPGARRSYPRCALPAFATDDRAGPLYARRQWSWRRPSSARVRCSARTARVKESRAIVRFRLDLGGPAVHPPWRSFLIERRTRSLATSNRRRPSAARPARRGAARWWWRRRWRRPVPAGRGPRRLKRAAGMTSAVGMGCGSDRRWGGLARWRRLGPAPL